MSAPHCKRHTVYDEDCVDCQDLMRRKRERELPASTSEVRDSSAVLPNELLPGNSDPPGYTFYDGASKRFMKLVSEGPWKHWLVYKHPDGQWVSLREATVEDWAALANAMSKALHLPANDAKSGTPKL